MSKARSTVVKAPVRLPGREETQNVLTGSMIRQQREVYPAAHWREEKNIRLRNFRDTRVIADGAAPAELISRLALRSRMENMSHE